MFFRRSKVGREGDVVPRVQILLVGKREDAPHVLNYGLDGCDVVRRELCSLGEVTPGHA